MLIECESKSLNETAFNAVRASIKPTYDINHVFLEEEEKAEVLRSRSRSTRTVAIIGPSQVPSITMLHISHLSC